MQGLFIWNLIFETWFGFREKANKFYICMIARKYSFPHNEYILYTKGEMCWNRKTKYAETVWSEILLVSLYISFIFQRKKKKKKKLQSVIYILEKEGEKEWREIHLKWASSLVRSCWLCLDASIGGTTLKTMNNLGCLYCLHSFCLQSCILENSLWGCS